MPLHLHYGNLIHFISPDHVCVSSVGHGGRTDLGMAGDVAKAAGPTYQKNALRNAALRSIVPGMPVVTEGYQLCRGIIHILTPVWQGGQQGEEALLRTCYRGVLEEARMLETEAVDFPLLASGYHGFPYELALHIAVSEIRAFLNSLPDDTDMDVNLVLYRRSGEEAIRRRMRLQQIPNLARALSEETAAFDSDAFPELDAPSNSLSLLVSESRPASVPSPEDAELGAPPLGSPPKGSRPKAPRHAPAEAIDQAVDHLHALFSRMHGGKATFQETVLRMIDDSGMKDSEVYRRANLSRQHFSKIRSNRDYQPTKNTIFALSLALHLDEAELEDLLKSAGFAISQAQPTDMVILYCMQENIYDVDDVNEILLELDLKRLGQ
ncbi:MAG: macro domain-containing protein [Clostridia bacterium]|nr:macro domain-containing protein [Clostridia bacterium]